jgi:DNA primase
MLRAMPRRDLSYVDVEDFLRSLKPPPRNISRSGDEVDFSCPSANHLHGDQTPSARMNVRTTLWICHAGSCGLRGDAVTFLTAFHGLTESEAQRVIDERYGGSQLSVEAGGLQAEVERIIGVPIADDLRRVAPDEAWLERFHAAFWDLKANPGPLSYMHGRGFELAMLDYWYIGWDELSQRIAIPVHDADGHLVGFKGRALHQDQHPRYLILGDSFGRAPRYGFDTYRKSEFVFALDRAQGARAVIVEGELNAIMLHQHGELGAVSVAGSEFSKTQAELIIRRFSSAVVYFDGDEAGRHGTKKVVDVLSSYLPVSIVVDPPDDAAALGAAAIPLIAGAIPSLQAAI